MKHQPVWKHQEHTHVSGAALQLQIVLHFLQKWDNFLFAKDCKTLLSGKQDSEVLIASSAFQLQSPLWTSLACWITKSVVKHSHLTQSTCALMNCVFGAWKYSKLMHIIYNGISHSRVSIPQRKKHPQQQKPHLCHFQYSTHKNCERRETSKSRLWAAE